MKKLALILLLVVTSFAHAQRVNPDTLLTNDGAVIIHPILHGSLVLSWKNQMIYIDPYGGSNRFRGLDEPTLILITDIHGDHHDQKTLDALNTLFAAFIVPQAVREKLPDRMKTRTTPLANGQSVVVNDLEILAVPMYNLPETEDSRHPKGRGNGYILTIGDKRIYISGDTEDTKEMRNLRNIDVAFVCMNLPYTMSVDQAASAVNDFQPKVVYPFHYRGPDGLSDVESFKSQVNAENPEIEVRLRNWYLE